MVCDRATVLCRVLPRELVALVVQHGAAMVVQGATKQWLARRAQLEWKAEVICHIESFALGREPVALGVPPWKRRASERSSFPP